MAKTMAVANSANATSAFCASTAGCATATNTIELNRMARMPTPEIGEFDAPISPAM